MEPGHDGNPGKVCETELEVLQYGSYKVNLTIFSTLRDLGNGYFQLIILFFCLFTFVLKPCLQGKEVTKVRLHPRTGRRHQLRVHTMCLGHPIVGDFTYNPVHRDAVLAANPGRGAAAPAVAGVHPGGHHSEGGGEAGVNEATTSAFSESKVDGAGAPQRDIAERMMLHAHRLR